MSTGTWRWLGVVELAALLALVLSVLSAAILPSTRGLLTWLAAGALGVTYCALAARCGIGLISYSLLIIVVLPAISFWGFLFHGDGGMMASTISMVRAAFSEMSLSFLILYLIGFVLSMFRGLHSDRLDAGLVADATSASRGADSLSNWIFSTLSLLAAYIYQPSMPGLGYHEVEYNLVAGHAWNYVCLTAYVLVLASPKKTLVTWLAIIGVPVWLVLHFDRADILGLVILWLLLARDRDSREGQKQWLRGRAGAALVLGGTVVLLFAYIGAIRNLGFVWSGEVFVETIRTLFNYPTVQAVNHAFAAAVEFVARLGHVAVISDYPIRVIPSFFVAHPSPAELIVQQAIGTVYGMHLAGEFFLQFGLLGALWAGVAVAGFMWIGYQVMSYLFGPSGAWAWYAVSVLMIARIGWYGFFYYVKVMLVIVPVLLTARLVISEASKALDRGAKRASLP